MNHVNNLRLQNGIHLIMRQNHNFVKGVGKPNIINLGRIYNRVDINNITLLLRYLQHRKETEDQEGSDPSLGRFE